jgi:hypothetical protein
MKRFTKISATVLATLIIVIAFALPAFAASIGNTNCSYTYSVGSDRVTGSLTTTANYRGEMEISAIFNFRNSRTNATRKVFEDDYGAPAGRQTWNLSVNQSGAEQSLPSPLTDWSFVSVTDAYRSGFVVPIVPPFSPTVYF